MGLTCWACHRRVSQTVLDVIAFPTLALFAIEVSVFQSTQKRAVLAGSRFGYCWG